jgi:hypothetical protein
MTCLSKVLLVALTTAVASIPASAQAGGLRATIENQEADPTAAAKKLFDEGSVLYETSAYVEAVEAFTAAYAAAGRIEDQASRDKALHMLRFNLARAHYQAYKLDGARKHLSISRDLLHKYLDGVEEDITAEDLLAMVDEEIDQGVDGPGVEEAPGRGEPSPPEIVIDVAPTANPSAPELAPGRDTPRNRLLIGGIVSSAVGAAGFGVMGAGIGMGNKAERDYATAPEGQRDSIDARGELGNSLAIAGAAAGVVGLVTGAVLVGFGLKKRSDSRVSVNSTGLGLRASVRF